MGIWGRVVNLIFPGACRQCGTPVSAGAPTSCFCNRCWDMIRWFEDPCCPQCGLPYPSLDPLSVHQQSPAGHLCGACRNNPPFYKGGVGGILSCPSPSIPAVCESGSSISLPSLHRS